MERNEIKNLIENMEMSSSRGRAVANDRAIILKATKQEIEWASKERAENYIDFAREIGEMVRENRCGINPDELESVEFIREQLFDLAKKLYIELAIR